MRTTLELKGGWISSISRAKTILLIQIRLFKHLAVKRNMRVWMGTDTKWALCSSSLFHCSAVVRQNSLYWLSLSDSWFWRATVFKWEQFLDIVLIIICNNKQYIDEYILNWCFLLFHIHRATEEQGFQDKKEIDIRQVYVHSTA